MFAPFAHFFKTSGSFTTDFVILVVIFLIFFFYGMFFDKRRLISLILAFYPARFLYEHFPFMSRTIVLHGSQLIVLNKTFIFLIFLILIDIIISRYIFSESVASSMQYLRLGGFSIALTILFLIFYYTVLDISIFYNFSSSIDALFATTPYLFWWNLAPLALLLIL